MSRDRFLSHGRGLLLALVGIAAILWLAFSGQLVLYIHPRYVVFTVVMAIIAGVVAIAAAAFLPRAGEAEDGHEHAPRPPRRARWLTAGSIALILAATGVLLVVPPSTLTSSTVAQRELNASATTADSGDGPALVTGDGSSFTVKDWAGLLRQGVDEDFLARAAPDVTGFVTPDPDDPENVFYVARFVVTCCAVDAQPVGVPVYLPGWRDEHPVDSWVRVTGRFAANPSATSMQSLVIDPASVTAIDQPADPYVY
ncbi:MAG: TIGR03943 family protein [Protaetiibacter sp.]